MPDTPSEIPQTRFFLQEPRLLKLSIVVMTVLIVAGLIALDWYETTGRQAV